MLANECTKFLLTISYWPHPGVKQAACSITWTQIIHFKNYEGGGGSLLLFCTGIERTLPLGMDIIYKYLKTYG